jgi:phage repressor protein C with HTH and peptisase S24 domain
MLYEILSPWGAMKSTTVGASEFRFRLSRVLGKFPSVAALAREIGVSDNAIYKWLAGRGQPSVANLVSLSRTAGVSLEWLATGREPAATPYAASRARVRPIQQPSTRPGRAHDAIAASTRDVHAEAPATVDAAQAAPVAIVESRDRAARDARAKSRSPAAPGRSEAASRDDKYTYLPRQIARARDGTAHSIRSEQVVDSLAFKTEWLRRRLAAAPHNLLLVEVSGDAMAPTLHDSDLILVDLGEPRFKQDGVYVLSRDGELEVKRLQRGTSGDLIIKSDNPAYQPTAVTRDRVGIIGRVVWAARRM